MATIEPAPPFNVSLVTEPAKYLTTGRPAGEQSFTIRITPDETYSQDFRKGLELAVVASIGQEEDDLLASLDGRGDSDIIELGKTNDEKSAWQIETNESAGKVTWVFKKNAVVVLTAGTPQDVAKFKNFTYSPAEGNAKVTCTLTYGQGSMMKVLDLEKKEPAAGSPSVRMFDVQPFPAMPGKEVTVSWDVAGLQASQRLWMSAKTQDVPKPNEGKAKILFAGTEPEKVTLGYGQKSNPFREFDLAELLVEFLRPEFSLIKPTDAEYRRRREAADLSQPGQGG